MLSTFLHSSWEKGRVNMIFQPDLAVDVYQLIKQLPSPYMVPTPNYIQRCLIFFNVWEGIGETTLSTFLHSSWERGCVKSLGRPSCGRVLTYEIILISVRGP